MTIDVMLGAPSLQRWGWTLAHLIWQVPLAAALLALALHRLRCAPARLRYAAALATMTILLALPVATFVRGEITAARAGAAAAAANAAMADRVTVFSKSAANGTEAGPRTAVGTPETPRAPFIRTPESRRPRLAAWLDPLVPAVQRAIPWMLIAWVAGVLLLSLRVAGGLVLLRRWSGSRQQTVPPEWGPMITGLSSRMGLHRGVRVRAAAQVATPMVVGFLRPVLLVPARGLPGLSDQDFAAILGHELGHIRRHDGLGQLVQLLAETLFFFHPGVWWVSRRVHCAREESCDDLAVALSGDRLRYARALADMEELRQVAPRFALAGTRGFLHQRIQRLLQGPAGPAGRSAAAPVLTHGLLSVVLLALASYLPGMPLAREPYPATVEEYEAQVRQALASGDDGRALELACHEPPGEGGSFVRHRESFDLWLALDEAMHRRYDEVCRPPANIETMIPFRWAKAGRSFGFGGVVEHTGETATREAGYDAGGGGVQPHLLIERSEGSFALAIDLDLDGRPELTYDGQTTRIGDTLSQATDRDPEGRRMQWLLAPPGVDPRERAQAMLYRDGEFFLTLVDVDGDGRGDCGRSGSTIWRPCGDESGKGSKPATPEGAERGGGRAHVAQSSPNLAEKRSPDAGARPPVAQAVPGPDPEIARRWASFQGAVQQALDAGDDAAVAERLCPMPEIDLKNFDVRFLLSIGDALGRRYAAAFTPPANADELAMGGWKGSCFMTVFNRDGVSSWGLAGDSISATLNIRRFGPQLPEGQEPGRFFLEVRTGDDLSARVDLDLDGSPEIVYENEEARIDAKWATAVDRAPDGRLVQWLVAPYGIDPRAQACVWLCRDAGAFWILVDTDGDGRSNCGWGGCLSENPAEENPGR